VWIENALDVSALGTGSPSGGDSKLSMENQKPGPANSRRRVRFRGWRHSGNCFRGLRPIYEWSRAIWRARPSAAGR
jgi:hypothetical protein